MANAPENFEGVVLPDHLKKLEYTRDQKLVNAATVKLEREDHTIGNLLRCQLTRDKQVVFVGYRQPHPLEHHVVVRVQTSGGLSNEDPYTPVDAIGNALKDLREELGLLSEKLQDAERDAFLTDEQMMNRMP